MTTIVCTHCQADDLGCTACGALNTLEVVEPTTDLEAMTTGLDTLVSGPDHTTRTSLLDRLTEQIRHEQSWAVMGREGDVRCLDCDLRYAEREEYGCQLGEGYGHSYDDAELAEARAPQVHDVDKLLVDSLEAITTLLGAVDAAAAHDRRVRADALCDAWGLVHVQRFDMDTNCTDERPRPGGPNSFYNGIRYAERAIETYAREHDINARDRTDQQEAGR